MPRPRPPRAVPSATITVTEYVKHLRCPDCDRLLRASGGTDAVPTFHCRRCRHTWNWLTRDAQRVILKVSRTVRRDERENRPLTRWR